MSDFASSLPIRTENAGDVIVKVADATVPSQQLKVNADGSIDANVSATDLDIRDLAFATDKVDVTGSDVTATVTATDLDIRDLAFATDKVDVSNSVVALDAATLAALETVTAIQGTSPWVVSSTDLDIRDLTHVSDSVKIGDGTDLLAVNTDGSINVVIQEDVGTETVDYNTAAAVAGGASDNHDLVFATASKLFQVLGSASGKMKIEIQIETGAATDVFNTICVRFNSTANPDCDMNLSKYAAIPAGARVRVIRTNKDVQAQDLYTTIVAILG